MKMTIYMLMKMEMKLILMMNKINQKIMLNTSMMMKKINDVHINLKWYMLKMMHHQLITNELKGDPNNHHQQELFINK
jgi:hypothetical protein